MWLPELSFHMSDVLECRHEVKWLVVNRLPMSVYLFRSNHGTKMVTHMTRSS